MPRNYSYASISASILGKGAEKKYFIVSGIKMSKLNTHFIATIVLRSG